MNWARGRRRKKRQKKREIFFLLTHKLHQFTLGIRLHLKKAKKRKENGELGRAGKGLFYKDENKQAGEH